MRFSTRSKLGIILSLVTILTLVSGFMVVAITSRGSATHAASSAGVSNQVSGKLAAQTLKLGSQALAHAASQTDYTLPGHSSTSSTNSAAAGPSTSLSGVGF